MLLLINRRYIRGHVSRAGNDLFLKIVLDDWDFLRVGKDATLALVTDEHEGTYRVVQAIRCPGGESIAWVILRRIGPLAKDHPPAGEVRVSYAVRLNKTPMLQA